MNNSIVCQSKAFWLHILLVVGSMSSVFCKYFLDKVAKHFWTLLHVQIGQSCKALASHDQTSHLMPCRHF